MNRVIELFIALLLVAMLVADRVYVWELSSYSTYESNHYQNKSAHDQKKADSPFLSLAADIEDFFKTYEKTFIVLSTIAIAWFTGTLWRATTGLQVLAANQSIDMKESLRIASESANAAKEGADALMGAERAYVKMSHVSPGVQWFEKNDELCQVEVEVKNYGRTPASVTDVKIWAKLLGNGDLLQEPFHYPRRDSTPNAFLVTNEAFFHQGHFPLRGQDLTDARCGSKTLWIYGHVDYIDTFKVRHRAGYVRVYNHIVDDGKQNNLFYMTEARYNYDRPRKKGEGNDWGDETPSAA